MADITPSPFTAQSIAHLYRWGEIEGWQLLLQHFKLTDNRFSFIVVFSPDDWAIALVRDQLRQILPEPGAIARVRFDPAKGTDSLAESLLEFVPGSANLRLIWIDADPVEPEAFEEYQRSWELALMKLNRYRNTLQKRLPCTVALALPGRFEHMLSGAAPDIWSIRSGVYRIEPPGTSRELIGRLPKGEWLSLDRDESGATGDPAETLAEANKLRGKPGRELLLATLLQRAGKQARRQMQWDMALTALQEAYTLQANAAADPELRWEICRDLANVFDDVAQYDRAEFYLQQALQTAEQHFGPDSHKTAVSLNNLAQMLQATNRLSEAEPLMRRALTIDEALFGRYHPSVAIRLSNLAYVLNHTSRQAEAEKMYRWALAIDEASFGKDHPTVANRLGNLAQILQDTKHFIEAEQFMKRALAIVEKYFGENHPRVALALNNLALLLNATNRIAEAMPLMRRALVIDEHTYGESHPKVATILNNLAILLHDMNLFSEAEQLSRRALAIDEATFGPDHPALAFDLNGLGGILIATNREADALPLVERSLAIFFMFQHQTGHRHPQFDRAIGNFTILLKQLGRNPQQIQRELAKVKKAAKVQWERSQVM